jgi:alkylation response protein AidB-like acyl-CoA dehydrogenase
VKVDRILRSREAEELLDMVAEICGREMTPRVDAFEREARYPDGLFTTLGELGLLSLPYSEEYGGGDQPYEVYLQVLEELARRWASVAVAVSVHVMACLPLTVHGTSAQKEEWLPRMFNGELIGGYSLSEAQAGSDAAAIACRAILSDGGYEIRGAKAWVTHGGRADFYTLFARTGDGSKGVSCFLAPGQADGLSFGLPEDKMGLDAIPTTSVFWDGVEISRDRLIGQPGQGLPIAFGALDSGRLGIAAIATGLAQAALDVAVDYANERTSFGRKLIDHQGLGFLLADMVAAVDSARATYLDAARRRDLGRSYGRQASIAKMVASDAAMKVATDAVQVLGGYGYTRDFAVERYMREAKIMQIFEGTNQIQRLVISRGLVGSKR